MRVLSGPLPPALRNTILSEYNRLTGERIAVQDFRRLTEQSPAGPALHALLETNGGRVAAHCCLLPFALKGPGGSMVVAKEHYFFLSEEYRSQAVREFERSKKPAAALLLAKIYEAAFQKSWLPILACAPPQLEPIHDYAGCRSVDFPVRDCYFILHPGRAWQIAHHLRQRTRASFVAASLCNQAYASCLSPWQYRSGLVRHSRIADDAISTNGHSPRRFSLPEDPAFLRWRYPDSSYVRLAVNDGTNAYIIAAKGSPYTYARVCQFRTPSLAAIPSLVEKLIREARASDAVGVRWSIWGDGPEQNQLVSELRKRTFLCVHRIRRLLLSSSDPQFASAGAWNLSDSLFTFDL